MIKELREMELHQKEIKRIKDSITNKIKEKYPLIKSVSFEHNWIDVSTNNLNCTYWLSHTGLKEGNSSCSISSLATVEKILAYQLDLKEQRAQMLAAAFYLGFRKKWAKQGSINK